MKNNKKINSLKILISSIFMFGLVLTQTTNIQNILADSDSKKEKYDDDNEYEKEKYDDDNEYKTRVYKKPNIKITTKNTDNLEKLNSYNETLISLIKSLEEEKQSLSNQDEIKKIDEKINTYNKIKKIIDAKLNISKSSIQTYSYKAPNNKIYTIIVNDSVVRIKKVDGTYTKVDFTTYDEAVKYLNKNAVIQPVQNKVVTTVKKTIIPKVDTTLSKNITIKADTTLNQNITTKVIPPITTIQKAPDTTSRAS